VSQDEKKPPGTSAGSPSSQGSASGSDLSLQEILGEIARGIKGSTRGNLAVQKIASDALQAISKQIDDLRRDLSKDVSSQIGQQEARRQQQIAELQRAFADLNSHVADIVVAMKALYDAFLSKSIDERNELHAAVVTLERAADDSKKFLTQQGGEISEDSISMSGFRVRWITVWKLAKAGVPLYKYGGLVAAISASIYKLLEGISPYTHWFRGWFE
jgi:predicted phage tail protein